MNEMGPNRPLPYHTITHPNPVSFWFGVHSVQHWKVVIDLAPRSLKRRPARTLSEMGEGSLDPFERAV